MYQFYHHQQKNPLQCTQMSMHYINSVISSKRMYFFSTILEYTLWSISIVARKVHQE